MPLYFGHGEFVHAGPSLDVERVTADVYLRATARWYPALWNEFHVRVLPKYRAFVRAADQYTGPLPSLLGIRPLRHKEVSLYRGLNKHSPFVQALFLHWLSPSHRLQWENLTELAGRHDAPLPFTALRQSLYQWAKPRNLHLPILLSTSVAELAYRTFKPSAIEPVNPRSDQKKPAPFLPSDCHTFEFEATRWHPLYETRKEAKDRLMRAFEAVLDLYLAKQVEDLKSSPAFQKNSPKLNLEHFDWLATYQVEGLSLSKIAQKFLPVDREGGRKTIAAGVEAAGQLLAGTAWDIWRRPAMRGGRPKAPRA